MTYRFLGIATLILLLIGGCDFDPGQSDQSATEEASLSKRGGKPKPPPDPEPTPGLFDPAPTWPLCGRITENPPAGWVPEDGCPADRFGNPAYTDGPISSTYGPRPLVSGGYRYDFHRGLDLATPVGTPVFAVADGEVRIAGPHSSYEDPLVQLRHFRPGATSCTAGDGCYHTNYMHLSGWVVSEGETVVKGQLIGYTGESASEFEHLHFEVRNAPGAHDVYSNWQRDAIHPLAFLPHPESSNASNMSVAITDVDMSTASNPKPTIQIEMPSGDELDLNRIEVEVYRKQRKHGLQLISQAGDTPVGNTPEGTGYLVNPSSFDLMQWNRMYSYKNSSTYPWSVFECDGTYESPYCADLPSNYDPNVHMDAASPSDPMVGQFNGVTVWPTHHNASSTTYRLTVRFDELSGPPNANDLCIKARALDAVGTATGWTDWGACH
ncbi:MAG: M23 family metallopeptidase [Rhodothermales bacterium]